MFLLRQVETQVHEASQAGGERIGFRGFGRDELPNLGTMGVPWELGEFPTEWMRGCRVILGPKLARLLQ